MKAILSALCADNISALQRLRAVIAQLNAAQYTAAVTPCDSGIGAHVRHILDHYDALWVGIESGHINYDARERDRSTEVDRDAANQRIDQQIQKLHDLAEQPLSTDLTVCMDCGSQLSTQIAAPTSLARELQFLVSHTVHHDALIAAAAKQLSIIISADFGVAPSTLRHATAN
ncbi:MAG: DinB family protein [Pseudomonadota bacterium]